MDSLLVLLVFSLGCFSASEVPLGFIFVKYTPDLFLQASVETAKALGYICVDCGFAYTELFGALSYGGACVGYVSAKVKGSVICVGFHILSPSGKYMRTGQRVLLIT